MGLGAKSGPVWVDIRI